MCIICFQIRFKKINENYNVLAYFGITETHCCLGEGGERVARGRNDKMIREMFLTKRKKKKENRNSIPKPILH
jgi:hypothetical protein